MPDRGDRPEFLAHCRWLLSQQSVQPDEIIIVSYPAVDDKVDIKARYMFGMEKLVALGCNLIVFFENDDWYSFDYIHYMADKHIENGRPIMMGINRTIYYNIRFKHWKEMRHEGRSSTMATIVTPAVLDVDWGDAANPYLDLYLWGKLRSRGKSIQAPIINLGIKHNIGLCGGSGHALASDYIHTDDNWSFMASIIDKTSLELYKRINAQLT